MLYMVALLSVLISNLLRSRFYQGSALCCTQRCDETIQISESELLGRVVNRRKLVILNCFHFVLIDRFIR